MPNIFAPQMVTGQPLAMPPPLAPVQPAPIVQAPPQVKQVFVPVPIMVPEKKPSKMVVSNEAIRKAQGIYPSEQQAKAKMIDQAKTTPTPTGAWGAPK